MFICEIGHNHNGNIELAKDLIYAAKDSGADIAKFQLYDIDKIKQPGDTNYEELKKAQLSRDQMIELYETSVMADIDFLCSVFDVERFNWYMEIKPKYHKIASRSIYDVGLIQKMRESEIPIIASLGAWEGSRFPGFIRMNFDAFFLFCLSRRRVLQEGVKDFPEKFGVDGYYGFSDHTVGMEYAYKAAKSGAEIIEKHFTLDKNAPGWDQPGSCTPEEVKEFMEFWRKK